MILTAEVATHTDVMRSVSGEMSVKILQEHHAQIGGIWNITREELKNMAKIYIDVDDETAFLEIPEYSYFGDVIGYTKKLVMTKELFIECYNKWIKGTDEEAADEQSI